MNYKQAKESAQRHADSTGFDYGVERNPIFGDYRFFMLPQKHNRQGHELSCEVVHCTNLDRVRPGHGPNA